MINIYRHTLTPKSSIGSLYFDNVFLCNTLEDPVRDGADMVLQKEEKIYGQTAIPRGCYEVTLGNFHKRGVLLPMLKKVPLYEGIYFHGGNKAEDSLGCIIVGMYDPKVPDFVSSSQDVLKKSFVPKVLDALKRGKLLCTITHGERQAA